MAVQVEGGVTAAKGFKAAGIYGGLRAKGQKPDLALVACDVDATVAGKTTVTWAFSASIAQVAATFYSLVYVECYNWYGSIVLLFLAWLIS